MIQISLIAAFLAGMVALFAPCCISYLLPAYFGTIFKERSRVLLMTVVYSLGIFLVMLPIVLGARALALFFFRIHDSTYLIGSLVMLGVGILSLLGLKLPMPAIGFQQKRPGDIPSVFMLGVFSGITSVCCAPVLIGVLTLSSLTPTTLQALGVGGAYVLGMVAPLYITSLLISRGNLLERPFFKRRLGTIHLAGQAFPLFVSNLIAAAIFLITGSLMLFLTLTGNVGMPTDDRFTGMINATAFRATEMTQSIPGVNVVAAVLLVFFLVRLLTYVIKE
ncbi:MAG: cytochrome c biogenesis protein CcdA [bacterium]|nr:cytochrome c biogenesis protein CcdA [bacterium]